MEQISEDITFQEYVSIIKVYYKQEDSYIRSLIINKDGVKIEKQRQKKDVIKEERLQVKKNHEMFSGFYLVLEFSIP
jgi:hypothetical protein